MDGIGELEKDLMDGLRLSLRLRLRLRLCACLSVAHQWAAPALFFLPDTAETLAHSHLIHCC